MNLKKFFNVLLALAMLTIFVSSTASAVTYYVDNQNGLDGYNGLSPTVGAPGVGPKLTIANAIAAASNGDTISVANTGSAYADIVPGAKTLTFISSAGTPVINSITIAAATTFGGPFALAGTGTLTLTSGAVSGAGNITINTGGTISRAAGSLNAAPVFAGTANLEYTTTATIGPEFPTSSSVLANLNVTGAIAVTVNRNIQMSGTLVVNNAGGSLVLAGNTLTITNTTAAKTHNVVGAVTATAAGGVVVSTTSGTVTFNGTGTLPGLTTSATGSTPGLISVTQPVSITGSVVVNSGSLTLTSPTGANGITGSLTNNGSGTVTVSATMTIGGNVSNTADGVITFGAVAITVTGNVVNSGSQTNTSATAQKSGTGNINFGNAVVVISGNLTNQPNIAGSTTGTGAADGGFSNCGNINFGGTGNAVTVTGALLNSSVSSFAVPTGANVNIFSNVGNINFATTTGALTFTGGVTNASSGFSFAGAVGSGAILASSVTTATVAVGTGASNQNLANNSSNTGGANGNIDFAAASTGAYTINGDVTLNAGAGTGDIILGTGSLTVSGAVANGRTVAGAVISAATGAGNDVSVGSINQTGLGSITFANTTGTFTVANSVNVSSGTVSTGATTGAVTFNGNVTVSGGTLSAAALTTGDVSFASDLLISGGTLDITASGASDVTVTGNLSFSAGSLKLGAGTRVFTVSGATSTISSGVTFTGGAATTLTFNRAVSAQTLTSGIAVVWPGNLDVHNTFPAAPTWSLQGANFTVTGDVTFSAGGAARGVNLNNFTLFVGGDFANNSGYTGGANGFVSMRGAGAQTVTGSASFFNIEADNAAGVTFGTGAAETFTVTGTFNLTNGTVAVGAGDAIAFNNATTTPTIVRNAGSFGAAPTFTTAVNVVYIGGNKTFSNEIAAGKLVNLTIATTGTSTVTANVDFDFTGTLTVNSGQTFDINTRVITANGASIVSNGTWVSTTGYINLNKAAGTALTGASALPEIRVASGSSGNSISGSTGITVGTNKDLTLANGTAAISLSFTGNGPHVTRIITQNANNTVTLNSDVIAAGNLVHGGGVLALGTHKLTVRGTTNSVDNTASVTGTGTLVINSTGATTLSATTGNATIAANVEMNMDLAATALTIQTNNLTISGNVTLTKGTLTLTTNLILTGSALTLTSNSSVAGAGVLDFAPTSGNTLTVTLAGATSFKNLTVDGNVVLAGASGDITINNGAFIHNAGVLNFGARNINLTGTTTFTRTSTDATYDATTGFLVYNSNGAFAQGTGFSIPNLKVSAALTVADLAFVVSNNLYLDGVTLTQKPGSASRLSIGVASGAIPTITVSGAGNLDAAPAAFAQGQVNYVFANAAVTVDDTKFWWPSTAGLANNVTVDLTAAATIVDFAKARQINGNLDLIKGVFTVDQNTTVTLASGVTISRTDNGSVNLVAGGGGNSAGALSAADVNITYYNNPTVDPAVAVGTSGAEYSAPTVVTNLLINAPVTLGQARTITGTVIANQSLTIGAATVANGDISLVTGTTLTLNAALTAKANITMAGTATTAGASALTFGGAKKQTLSIGSAATVANLNITQTVDSTVTVSGGNLTVSGTLGLNRGLLIMSGSNTLTLSAAIPSQGFTGGSVTSHVVGNVTKAISAAGAARYEFPVGSLTNYRPAAFTFATAPIFGFNLTVGEVDASPLGTNGLPIVNGVEPGVNITSYPDFYWLIKSNTNLGSGIVFNLELTAGGFTTDDVSKLRIIRRVDGDTTANQWSLQGTQYDNFIAGGIPTVTNINSQGGINPAGSRFTYGLSTGVPVGPGASVAGKVLYYNSANTPVSGVVVTLNTTPAKVDTTDANGDFSFSDVANGTYTLSAATTKAWGGVTANDALQVLRQTVGLISLSPLRLTAADVDNSGSVTANDALQIKRRVVGLITTFAKGDWVFAADGSVVVAGANLTGQNIRALTVGDVDSSFVPGVAKVNAAAYSSVDKKQVNPVDMIELPISVASEVNVGALTLSFTYPKELGEFVGVSSKASDILVKAVDGKVNMVWASLNSMNVKAGEALVTLRFKPTDQFKAGKTFGVQLDNSEIADANGQVIDVSLKGSEAEAYVPAVFALDQNYPNPFNPSTIIKYDLPVNGNVKLVVYNTIGEVVATLVSGVQEAGSYKLQWNASNMASGIYFYRIDVNAGEKSFSRTMKMILMK